MSSPTAAFYAHASHSPIQINTLRGTNSEAISTQVQVKIRLIRFSHLNTALNHSWLCPCLPILMQHDTVWLWQTLTHSNTMCHSLVLTNTHPFRHNVSQSGPWKIFTHSDRGCHSLALINTNSDTECHSLTNTLSTTVLSSLADTLCNSLVWSDWHSVTVWSSLTDTQ